MNLLDKGGVVYLFTPNVNDPLLEIWQNKKYAEFYFEKMTIAYYSVKAIKRLMLEIKRKIIESQTEKGLYPYSSVYLKDVKKRTGQYWHNHFNTIGLVGMHEALLNFMGKGIETPEGQEFGIEIMNELRAIMVEFQKERNSNH